MSGEITRRRKKKQGGKRRKEEEEEQVREEEEEEVKEEVRDAASVSSEEEGEGETHSTLSKTLFLASILGSCSFQNPLNPIWFFLSFSTTYSLQTFVCISVAPLICQVLLCRLLPLIYLPLDPDIILQPFLASQFLSLDL